MGINDLYADGRQKLGTEAKAHALAVRLHGQASISAMYYGMEVQQVVGRLASLQRSACLAITGAVSSTPAAALNCSLNLTLVHKINQGNGEDGSISSST